jgi:hypothetical protein
MYHVYIQSWTRAFLDLHAPGREPFALALSGSFWTLKGLSGEMEGGSQVVAIDRYTFKDVPLEVTFLFYATTIT